MAIVYYRVRKSWGDSDSQQGAFVLLANAKKCADSNPGYFVFDANGIAVYPLPYMIQAKVSLAIWSSSTSNTKTGSTGAGVFTITEVKDRRGRLLSGKGWVALADVPLIPVSNYIVTYKSSSDKTAPMTVMQNGVSSPVWNQNVLTGAYAEALKKHGCGACCAAVAARLHGYKTCTPETVLQEGVKQWAAPTSNQSYALSCNGMATILENFGIDAASYTVTASNLTNIKSNMTAALKQGKQVILFTHKYDNNDPFGSGDHYVLAVGYDKNGKIVVANSAGGKVQLTDITTIGKYLYHSCTGKDDFWLTSSAASAGIVIVG